MALSGLAANGSAALRRTPRFVKLTQSPPAPEPTMHRHCSPWTAHQPNAAPGGVVKRSIAGTGATLVRVEVPAGTAAAPHSHPHEQFVQVLSGSGTLETEDGTVRFEAGSVFHFPEGTWHRAEFETETVLVETNLG